MPMIRDGLRLRLKTYLKKWVLKEEALRKEIEQLVLDGKVPLENIKESIEVSKLKQKILTYMYNNNITKAEKNIDKLKQLYVELSDDLTFNPERCVTAVLDLNNTGRGWMDKSNDGSRKLLDEMKKNLEWFDKTIAFLKC
jgi:hypothetical protein|tara:strand:- start:203 stop:622 length:420 start_codon:yes stop_codon:yes gene_type:complete